MMSSNYEPTYRELRLARYFQNPGDRMDSVLSRGSTGPACRNIRIALNHLGFELPIPTRTMNECSSPSVPCNTVSGTATWTG